jgi:hypothetical protein
MSFKTIFPHDIPFRATSCFSVRWQIATACAVYAYKEQIFHDLLPYAQCTLAIGTRIRSGRLQFATVCALYNDKGNQMLILPI